MHQEPKDLTNLDPFVSKVQAGMEQALAKAQSINHTANGTFEQTLPLTLALSGGSDSTALLLALVALRTKLSLKLSACHVNHQMRGEESDQDEEMCRSLCHTLEVPLIVKRLEDYTPSLDNKKQSESTLRQIRYCLLQEATKTSNSKFICVAHTADDQIETQLFRLFRGTAPRGLLGMETARALNPSISILRPLLNLQRSDCLAYLSRLAVNARYDSSNADLSFTRNFIRHNIVPTIKERFPNFETHLHQLKELISAEEDLLAELTEKALGEIELDSPNQFNLHGFQRLPVALKLRVIAHALQKREVEISYPRVCSVLELINQSNASSGTRLSLNGQWDVEITKEAICWVDKGYRSYLLTRLDKIEQPVKVPGITIVPTCAKALAVEALSMDEVTSQTFPQAFEWQALVDLTAVKLPLVIRHRRPCDLIRPFGMDKLVKLKKYLHNHRPSHQERNTQSLLFLADQEEVLWIPGLGISNKIKVTGQPTHKLTWMPLSHDKLTLC